MTIIYFKSTYLQKMVFVFILIYFIPMSAAPRFCPDNVWYLQSFVYLEDTIFDYVAEINNEINVLASGALGLLARK